MDLIITTLLKHPDFWNYDKPLNLLAIGFILIGFFPAGPSFEKKPEVSSDSRALAGCLPLL